jgi:hypothetical protein
MAKQEEQQKQSNTANTAAPQRVGEASEEQLAEWRNQTRGIYEVEVTGEDGTQYVGYIRRPDRYVKDEVFQRANEGRMIAAGERIIENCWLGGADKLADGSDEYNDLYDAACMAAFEAISMPDANAKKL